MGRCGNQEELSPSHIQAYLTKPVRQTELYQQIEKVMGAPIEQTVLPDRSADAAESEPADAENRMDTTVLLAEDNPVNQEVIRAYLLDMGYRVDLVTTGLQAVAAFERKPYDLILMDCQMPDMDGFEATMLLRLRERQQNAQRRIPIIAVTANAFEHERDNCLAAGMDDYISKPFNQNDLSAMLQRWLNQEGPTNPDRCEGDTDARPPRERLSNLEKLRCNQIFDPKALNNIAALNQGSSNEDVDEIIRIYLDVTPAYLANLKAAISAGDALSAERTAHNMKSSSATLGAMKLAAQCRELEKLAHEKTLDTALFHIAEIESSFKNIQEIFSASLECQVQQQKSG
jgi:CheY-like chemotaxis protein/HPt (histidine-containing phosphotransfer) domain-containing protein